MFDSVMVRIYAYATHDSYTFIFALINKWKDITKLVCFDIFNCPESVHRLSYFTWFKVKTLEPG